MSRAQDLRNARGLVIIPGMSRTQDLRDARGLVIIPGMSRAQDLRDARGLVNILSTISEGWKMGKQDLLDAKMKVFELLKFKFCFFQNLSPVFSTFMFESFD